MPCFLDCEFGRNLNYWYFRLKYGDFPNIKHLPFEELLWKPGKHYINKLNISETLNHVSNTLQNFKFMGATVFEIVVGPADRSLVKGVGTKRLGKGRVNPIRPGGGGAQRPGWPNSQLPIRNLLSCDAQTW